MSIIPMMTLDELIQSVDKMAKKLEGWGWSIACLGNAYTATLYNETVEYQGGFMKYVWMPVTSKRCGTYFDALSFCLNTLYETYRNIEDAKKIAEEGLEEKAG